MQPVRRACSVLLLALAFMVLAGCSQTSTSEQASATSAPTAEPTETALPVATKAATQPEPTAVAVATAPVVPTPTATPPAEPELPSEPLDSAPRYVIDGQMAAVDPYGVLTSADRGETWTLHQAPPIAERDARCWVHSANRIVISNFSFSDTEAPWVIQTFDLDTLDWTEASVPRPPDDVRVGGLCDGVDLDGTVVWARHNDGLSFFVEEGAAYRQVRVDFPESEYPFAQHPYVGGLFLDQDRGQVIVNSETWPGDCGPASTFHAFPIRILLDGTAAKLTWPQAEARRLVELEGEERLVQVGGEVWHTAQIESYGFFRSEAGCYEPGRWAAGPIGSAAAEFPRGLEPRLYPYGDTVVAEVPLVVAPTGFVTYFERSVYPDWWLYDRENGEWVALPESPAVPIADVGTDFVPTEADPARAVPSEP